MRINTPDQLIERLTIETANIAMYQTQCGFGAKDVQDCQQDLANLTTAMNNMVVADADKQSVTQVRDRVYNGDASEIINKYPTFAMTDLPFPDQKPGAKERYLNRRARARLAPDYNTQIGEALGYETPPAAVIPPESVKPQIEAFPSATGYLCSVVVTNRAEAAMWEVQLRRKGQETWQTIKSATGKSTDINLTPTTPGDSEQVQLRVLLYKNNQPYGQPSDPVYATFNP